MTKAKPATQRAPATLDECMERMREFRYWYPEDGHPAAIPMHYAPGKSRLMVVTGPNAGGKSFFRRLIPAVYPGVECIGLSMEFRTGTGAHAGNIGRAFVFGDEGYRSTGAISAQTVLTAINTSKQRDNAHVLFWDEPDIGLSEGYARGVGVAIAKYLADPAAKLKAAFVVTHSKALVRELARVQPHYTHLGSDDAPPTLADWLAHEEPVCDIEELTERAHARLRAIRRILDSVK